MLRMDNNIFDFNQDNPMKKPKMSKILLIAFLMAICAGLGSFAVRFLFKELSNKEIAQEKEFSSNGMTITLTTAFKEGDYITQTASYVSKDVIVLALKESFASSEGFGDISLKEYGELVLKANKKTDIGLSDYDGLQGFEYDATDGNTKQDLHFWLFTYKADDAFWLIQFCTLQEYQQEFRDKILFWAKSVRFE